MQEPRPSSAHARSWLLLPLLALVAVTAAHSLDWWAYTALANPRLADRDLGRMLRVMGFFGFWLIAAIALGLNDAARPHVPGARRYARALLLLFGAGVGGLAAELMKLVVRRERPNAELGEYVFRGWAEQPFHTGGLGLASSHTGVAFGAAFMLARLFPRARWIWYMLAAGCAYSRVAAGAHFLSDVVVAAVLSYAVVALLWWRFGTVAEPAQTASITPVVAEPLVPVPAYLEPVASSQPQPA
jgi:membrane-associated phospholipid phosphatase